MAVKNKRKTDLNKLKEIMFRDIEILLDNLGLQYEIINDNVFMACPLHGGDNPRGLSVSISGHTWRCWTRDCQENSGSGIFSFVQSVLEQKEEKDVGFGEVLKFITKIYNVGNECQTYVSEEEKPEEGTLQKVLKNIKKKDSRLKPKSQVITPEHVNTCGNSIYFEQRGFDSKTLKYFGVEDCMCNCSMKNRAIIPVHDQVGNYIGYIARSIKDSVQPKYLFSGGFKKSEYLYNYHRASVKAVEKSCLFLVEGQGDVWKMWDAGVQNCVGLFGKDVSQHQKRILMSSGATTLVVLTDNDQAGREAKMKIQRNLNRMFTVVFPKMERKDIGAYSVDNIKTKILTQINGGLF